MTLPNPPHRPLQGSPGNPAVRPTPSLRPATAPLPPLRPAGSPPSLRPPGSPAVAKPAEVVEGESTLDPIGLVEGGEDVEKKIKAFGLTRQDRQRDWKRTTNTPGTGATRLKTFHGKLSDEGLGYLDDAVNEWLDSHPEVEVKFVTSTVGTFEGKIRMPALVLNIWY